MKLRWRILYILLGSLSLFPSCTDEDLDTTMYGGREDTEFYNNLEEINQALTACYQRLCIRRLREGWQWPYQ